MGRLVAPDVAAVAAGGAVAAQKAVGEPLREVGEQHRRLLARDELLAAKQLGDVRRRGRRALALVGGRRRELAAVVGLVDERVLRREVELRAEPVGARWQDVDALVDEHAVDAPLEERHALDEQPERAGPVGQGAAPLGDALLRREARMAHGIGHGSLGELGHMHVERDAGAEIHGAGQITTRPS